MGEVSREATESNRPSCSETVRLLNVDVLTSDSVWKINVAGTVLQNGPLRLYQAGILYPRPYSVPREIVMPVMALCPVALCSHLHHSPAGGWVWWCGPVT